jgi:(S)-mandelate dehydrogenase
MLLDIIRSPAWLMALARHGRPKFANIKLYAGENASGDEVIRFTRQEMGGAFTWDEIARFRDRWRRPLVLKGILHPLDAAKAVALGIEGIWVSNHGGRQIEALPPSIDVLPAIVAEVGIRATVIMDSGIRSGLDVVRAVALGADATFAGKAFLWGLGALGEAGPGHVIDLLIEEARAALGQIGAHSLAEARSVAVRHPGAFAFPKSFL